VALLKSPSQRESSQKRSLIPHFLETVSPALSGFAVCVRSERPNRGVGVALKGQCSSKAVPESQSRENSGY
jgi:hypothetical protein